MGAATIRIRYFPALLLSSSPALAYSDTLVVFREHAATQQDGGGSVINTERRKIPFQRSVDSSNPEAPGRRLSSLILCSPSMAVSPHAMPHSEQDDDDFTFPTPPRPQFLAGVTYKDRHHHRVALPSPPPGWLHLSSPIRRSFSAADCAASPWRRCRGGCSPALSDYVGFLDAEEEEEEERMDSLWEDLNDEGDDMFPDVSRRRSVGGADVAARARTSKEREKAAVLGASRSSRRRPPGLVTVMRALKKMFVAHKDKSRVHRDEQSCQSTIASASAASPSPSFCKKK